jgi:Fe-S oxidoreductase
MNDVYEAPRELVRATGARLAEMPRNRADSFCCGGGGGGVWTEVEEDRKPSEERLREAVADTDGDVEQFVVACPMCTTMFEDGRKTGGFEDDVEIVDLTELLVDAMAASGAVDGTAANADGQSGTAAD